MIQSSDVARVALRTPLLQATWNYERQQGLGWAWCFQPILERLYPEQAERRRRLADHTAYFNTQPTLASLALGAIAGLEARVAGGEPPELVHRARQALGSALAAMGDRLFWATLRPFAATMGVIAALGGGSWRGALVMWVIYNAVHLPLRFAGVSWGARRGPEVLDAALRGAIDRMVRSLSLIGSAAVGVAVAMTLAPGGEPHTVAFQAGLLGGIGLGLLTAMRARPSPTQWALGVGALALAAGWWR